MLLDDISVDSSDEEGRIAVASSLGKVKRSRNGSGVVRASKKLDRRLTVPPPGPAQEVGAFKQKEESTCSSWRRTAQVAGGVAAQAASSAGGHVVQRRRNCQRPGGWSGNLHAKGAAYAGNDQDAGL